MGFWSEVAKIFKGPDLNDPAIRERTAREWGGGRYEQLQKMPTEIDQLKRKLKDVQRKIDELYGEAGRVDRERQRDTKGKNARFFDKKLGDLGKEIEELNSRDKRDAERDYKEADSKYYRELKAWNKLPKDIQDSAFQYYKNPSQLR